MTQDEPDLVWVLEESHLGRHTNIPTVLVDALSHILYMLFVAKFPFTKVMFPTCLVLRAAENEDSGCEQTRELGATEESPE